MHIVTWFPIDFSFNLFWLAVSTILQIEKTHSLGVEVAGALNHICTNLAIWDINAYCLPTVLRGSSFSFGYVHISVAMKYDKTFCLVSYFTLLILVDSMSLTIVSFSPNESISFSLLEKSFYFLPKNITNKKVLFWKQIFAFLYFWSYIPESNLGEHFSYDVHVLLNFWTLRYGVFAHHTINTNSIGCFPILFFVGRSYVVNALPIFTICDSFWFK